ncbi:type IV secretion system protein VirB3 [Salinicola sp. NYA28a]
MFTLYKGATRLPTFLGVPRTPMIVTLMACATLWLHIQLWALLVLFFAWFIEFCICKHDDRAFRILALWFRTKGINRIRTAVSHRRFNKGDEKNPLDVWQGSSYSPMSNVREDQ